jgi:endonuclease/exonuclease/phosphatase family metal-dependent hydrolase
MAELRETSSPSITTVGLVLAGDFNSTPLSAIYHLINTCVRASFLLACLPAWAGTRPK